MRLWVKICVHLLLMLVVLLFILWIATLWLDSWTNHGEFTVVPDVEKIGYEQARDILENDRFSVEIADSVYENAVRPGFVVGQFPKAGSKVKGGRTVYLTINAFSPRAVTIPMLVDMSQRQAVSILESLGFKNVVVREVPSEFKDLVLSASCDGRRIISGQRLPVTSRIELEIGIGEQNDLNLEQEVKIDPDAIDDAIPVTSLDLIE